MIVISLWQPSLGYLLENANEADDQILEGIGIGSDEIKQRTKSGPHDSGIVVAEPLPEIGDEMSDGGRGLLVEAVESHDRLLSDGLLGMGEKVDNLGQNGGNGLVVDELADGGKGGGDDEEVVGAEIFLDGVDDEDDEVVVVGEEESDGEVAGAFEEEGIVVSHLDGVDISEGGVVAEHFDIDEANEVLLHLPLGDVGLGKAALEGFDLAEDDAVLLRLRSGLADRLHQLQKLLRLPEPALRSHRQLSPNRLQLLHFQFVDGRRALSRIRLVLLGF